MGIFGAVAKAALRGKGKSRARKAGDELYNARRRYTRSAQRYMKMAEGETGILSERYKELARGELKKALGTYEKEPTSKPVKDLMNRLGVGKQSAKGMDKERLVRESKRSLASSMKDSEVRREREARAILNSKIGHRIYGGTVSIWKGREDIDAAIMEHFGVDSMADVIDLLEQEIDIYQVEDVPETSSGDVVRMKIEQAAKRLG